MEFLSNTEDQGKGDTNRGSESPIEMLEKATTDPNEIPYCLDCVPVDEKEVPPVERVVLPKDVADINDEDESIYIIGTRDGKVTMIDGLDHMKKLKTLILRSCLIGRMEGVENLVTLQKLELYDNHIEEINCINQLSNLRILDLSFNAIREMIKFAEYVPLLEELYIAQNKLRKIEGLQGLVHLRVLDLGANRIRVIEGLETNTSLRSLWLGKNKIEKIEGLDTLVNLEQLDIQNNRLTELGDGLMNLHKLSELYLACNRIGTVSGLPVPSQLSTIDLSTNGVSSVEGIENQPQLEEFWVSSSQLKTFADLAPLAKLPSLRCIYLEHSPIAKDFEYRLTLTKMIPSLEQLDATNVNRSTI